MDSRLPPDLEQPAWSAALTWFLAGMGRLLWHIQEVQKSRRRFFSWHLIWEVMTALAIGFVADGLAAWLGQTGKVAIGIVVVVSYLGPRGIEMAIERMIGRLGPPRS